MAINVFINSLFKGFFSSMVCNARVIKPMEKPRDNKIPRFDTFWGGGWKSSGLFILTLCDFAIYPYPYNKLTSGKSHAVWSACRYFIPVSPALTESLEMPVMATLCVFTSVVVLMASEAEQLPGLRFTS